MPSSLSLPDLSGRTAVVTGASSGIGAAVTRALAGRGAHVVLAVRNPEKGREMAATVTGSTEVRALDLADLSSIYAFVESWDGSIDLLINNAGVSSPELRRTKDGFELMFGTNHLGHFVLTNGLLPHVTGRVVTVSSQAERGARLDFDDLNWEKRSYRQSRAYNDSKLANLLFTSALQRRLDDAGSPVRALAAHPGFVITGIYDEVTSRTLRYALARLGQDADAGALPVLLAATGDLAGDTFTGPEHLAHMRGGAMVINRSKAARDPELAERLWTASEELTGVVAAG